jgi:adenine phosphoribosyltransferase
VSDRDYDPRAALLRARIRDIPDFPKPGILFRDLTPLMGDGAAMRTTVELLVEKIAPHRADTIVAIESRGFIFGAPVAVEMGIGFAPVRKPGKLPWRTTKRTYDLEYGTDSLEMHADAVVQGTRVVIVDDLLATGGTVKGTIELVERLRGEVVGLAFLVELEFLKGRDRLDGRRVTSVIQY